MSQFINADRRKEEMLRTRTGRWANCDDKALYAMTEDKALGSYYAA